MQTKPNSSGAKPTRSELMAKIRSKDTSPEIMVRRLLFGMGYRYRIHKKDLPGCPDIVFISRKKAIFVNGCFWHQHQGCSRATTPSTHQGYWLPKLERNRKRDIEAVKKLKQEGWGVLTIWECEIKQQIELKKKLQEFLGPRRIKGNYGSQSTRGRTKPTC